MWHTVSWMVSLPTETVFLAVDSITVNKSMDNLAAPPSGSEIPTISLGGADFEMLQDEGKGAFATSFTTYMYVQQLTFPPLYISHSRYLNNTSLYQLVNITQIVCTQIHVDALEKSY